jgi:hypothetical protein
MYQRLKKVEEPRVDNSDELFSQKVSSLFWFIIGKGLYESLLSNDPMYNWDIWSVSKKLLLFIGAETKGLDVDHVTSNTGTQQQYSTSHVQHTPPGMLWGTHIITQDNNTYSVPPPHISAGRRRRRLWMVGWWWWLPRYLSGECDDSDWLSPLDGGTIALHDRTDDRSERWSCDTSAKPDV